MMEWLKSHISPRETHYPEPLLEALYPFQRTEPTTIKIYRSNVKNPMGRFFLHYFNTFKIGENEFEFHPGSRPETIKPMGTTDGILLREENLCEECTKEKITSLVNQDNKFNLGWNNCEHIILGTSVQAGTTAAAIIATMVLLYFFSWIILLFIFLALIYLFYNNSVKPVVKSFKCIHLI